MKKGPGKKKKKKQNKQQKRKKKGSPGPKKAKPANVKGHGDQDALAYKAGDYAEIRRKFLNDIRKSEGLSFKEACDRWNLSDKRAGLLAGMSYSEMKRRRFI